MTDIEPKVVTIQLAMDGMTMQSTHVGNKTYYAYDRTGTIRPIMTRALYVRELKQDVYPKAKDGSIDPANSFSFVSEYSESLFYLRVAAISATKYAKMSGYELWPRQLGHGPNACIRKPIAHSIRMDELKSA